MSSESPPAPRLERAPSQERRFARLSAELSRLDDQIVGLREAAASLSDARARLVREVARVDGGDELDMCSKHDRADLRARAALLRAGLASVAIDVALPRLPEQAACLRATHEYVAGIAALCAPPPASSAAGAAGAARRLAAALRACAAAFVTDDTCGGA